MIDSNLLKYLNFTYLVIDLEKTLYSLTLLTVQFDDLLGWVSAKEDEVGGIEDMDEDDGGEKGYWTTDEELDVDGFRYTCVDGESVENIHKNINQ